MTDNLAPKIDLRKKSTTQQLMTQRIWFIQAAAGVLIAELLVLFGAKALGISAWVGPILLLGLGVVAMQYLFTGERWKFGLVLAAAGTLILGLMLI